MKRSTMGDEIVLHRIFIRIYTHLAWERIIYAALVSTIGNGPTTHGNKIATLIISWNANATLFVKRLRNILTGFLFRERKRVSAIQFRMVTLSTAVAHAFVMRLWPNTSVIY